MGKQGQGNGNGSIVDNSKQSSVVNTDEIRARDTSCGVDAIEGPNKDVGTSGSDYESQLSDSSAVEKTTDSGIEASDGLRVNGDIFDTESRQHLPSDASPTSSFSQMLNTVMPFSATEETSSCETADDIPASLTDLFGTVEGICPESGSVEGGFKFYISFTEALSDEIQYGEAHFERAANVPVEKLNPFTMYGNVARSPSPGKVTVTVITEAGEDLGFTLFNYIDDKENMLKQLVKDPMLQAKYFRILSTKFANGNLTSNSNIAQPQGQRILEENDFPVQTKQQQSVKFLRLMVYTAAETDAQDFIEMVFSTSAGQIVFNSYKDRTPLPEDVARANGHKELAQYLQDVNTRLSKEAIGDVQCCAIDWLELVKAVQKRCYSAVETKQKQSVELLQLLDYSAVKRDALWFIESVTSAGQDNLDYYKDRRPWPENVARAHGNEELAPFQDVHTRLSLNKNVHSTLTDWLELEEAEQKQSLATLESPLRLDLSDDDDDDSSGYFADAETSSCGSFDDDIGWSELSGNEEPCVHDEISNEVQNISEWDDLPMTFSSRAPFNKNERIIGESTNGQITSEVISFAGKQSSCCLNKEEKGEFSELSKFMRTIRGLLALSLERLLFKGLELPLPMRLLEGSFISTHKVKLIISDVVERPFKTNSVFYGSQLGRIWFPKEKCFSAIKLVDKRPRAMDLRLKRETSFFHWRLLMKEQLLLEREQLFGMQRLLAQKLSTKTELLLSVRLLKRERKFQGTYELSGDPLCKSVNSYEGEPKEVALAKLRELLLDTVRAARKFRENNLRVHNSRISELQQAETNACKELTLCVLRHGAPTTYEEVQTSLHVNDVQLEDLAVEFCDVFYTKPLESNLRKTDKITVGTLYDLSCDLRKEWKYLALALGVHDIDVTNDLVDDTNQTLRENCYNMLLLWKQRFGPQATYQALEVGLCHDSVQREDLVKKYCHDFISSAKFAVPLWLLLLQMTRTDMD